MAMNSSGVETGDMASQILRALPGVAVLAFSAELRILAIQGRVPIAHGLDSAKVVGKAVAQVIPAGQWHACEPLFRAALQGKTNSIKLDADDDDAVYAVDVAPLLNAAGDVSAGVCFWRELTEHARLASELEQRARLMDLAHDAIIARAPSDSTVVYWNRGATEIYGFTAEEAAGQVTHDLLTTEFPLSRAAVDAALEERGRWDGELWHTRKDGGRIPVSSRQALVRDERGEALAIIELNADITERKRAEQELRAAEERFRGLIEAAPDAMVIVDEHGGIVLVNERAEALFGYARRDLLGKAVEILVPDGLREGHVGHRETYVDAPRARPMGEGLDLRAKRKDGTEFLAEISLSPLRTDGGLLISASIRDISRQLLRQLEQALVPRMKISVPWRLAWRYRPSVRAMRIGGDFIGVCEPPGGSLSLLIGDVTGHGPSAAGTASMLRAAWLGAALAGVPIESLPELLHLLLIRQADPKVGQLATVCVAEIDRETHELRLLRAGHAPPLLITPNDITEIAGDHGPALGLEGASDWPLQQVHLPPEAAIMFFTDGVTERRQSPGSPPLGLDDLLSELDSRVLLTNAPIDALDLTLDSLFPQDNDDPVDDVAVMLVNLMSERGES